MADEGSSRKRRNRELEEATLGATLSDHVSNGDENDRRRGADEGSSRKRRNREFKEVALAATLNDHVSNGERKENSPVDCFPRESYAYL